jgi:trigger factor
MDFLDAVKVTKIANSQITIEGEVPFEYLNKERATALKVAGQNIEMPGFRKGHVPEEMLVKKIGEMGLLTEMAERALAKVYPEIVKHHKLEVIGQPQVAITKIAPNNPLGFTITVATLPEITLPDYKKIAETTNKDKASSEVTDEEVETQIKDIQRQKIAFERLQKKAAGQTHTHADGTVHEGPAHDEDGVTLPTPESEAQKEEEAFDPANIELPELTDEYVKGLGQPGQFATVDDFKTKLKEHLAIEKKQNVEASHRAKITDEIIALSQFELPQIMIDSEIGQMLAQMNEDLNRANLKMDDYLTHIKKTKEDLIKEWTPAAEKRARLQLVLNEIAKKEEVKPDQEQLESQVKQLLEQYKDADPMRVRIYVASVMQNEAVMKMLESQ